MNSFDLSAQTILLETIFRHIPQLIFWKNKNSIYLGCNQPYANLLGLNSPQDIIGKTDYELGWLSDGDTADLFRSGDQETLTGHSITNQEEWLSVKNGKKILTLVNKVPLIGYHGEVLGVLGVATDITEKKRLEVDLTQTTHKLKGMTIVSASIAHELRTPLGALKNIATGIQQLTPKLIAVYRAAISSHLNIPYISATHLQLCQDLIPQFDVKVNECNHIIDMLLSNLELIQNTQKKPKQLCSARNCIRQALTQYIFPPNAPKVIWNEESDFNFYGNPRLLIHVLFNLLKNAIYFIRKAGKGCIQIWIQKTKAYNAIHFKDTGLGVLPENLPHLFDPFFTAGTIKGTGIGLAFCDLSLQLLGGSISCQSQWRKYTEFTLTFPTGL
jgi:PAS domain S-box-containing protein